MWPSGRARVLGSSGARDGWGPEGDMEMKLAPLSSVQQNLSNDMLIGNFG